MDSPNYIEYVVLDHHGVAGDIAVYDFDISQNTCNQLFELMHHKHYKHYERSIKQYVHRDMFYEIAFSKEPEPDIKAYRKTIETVTLETPNIIKLACQKQKVPIHAFPSTNDIQEVNYIKRLTFRKSNRIFVNIDYVKDTHGRDSCKAFINVNLDANTDVAYINMELEPLIRDLHAVLKPPPPQQAPQGATC